MKLSYLQFMKRNLFAFLALFLFNLPLKAQLGLNASEGSRSLAMGGAGSMIEGPFAIFNNQAGLTNTENLAVILDVQRRFSLADLSVISAGVVKNTRFGHFGLMVSNYGFESYNDQKFGLAYAKKLTDILSIGAQINALQIRIENFGSTSKISAELGIMAALTSELRLAAHITNPINIAVTESTDIDSRFRIGLDYSPSNNVSLIGEIDKILDGQITFRAGIQYKLISSLFLRAGYSTTPGTVSFGLSYRLKESLMIDAAYSFHEQLGYTPGISLIWNR